MADTYFFHNHNGRRLLPTKEELESYRNEGVNVVLMLDANVCLDIVHFVNHKKQARVEKPPLFHLLEYVQKWGVELSPIFGLLELCSNNRRLELDSDKFMDMKNKIDFASSYPLKLLRSFQFDYQSNYLIFRKPHLKSDLSALNPMLLASYSSLLKIYDISKNGLGRQKAVSNVHELLDWMLSDLGIILGVELQLGLNIFGGENELGLTKMAAIGAKPEKVVKASWGTAWDIFNIRHCCNSFSFSKHVREDSYLIFVTNDQRLDKLISQQSLSMIIDASNVGGITNMHNLNVNLPHYDDEFRGSFSVKLAELTTQRFKHKKDIDENNLKIICQQLEENLATGN